ncbi:head-tail connector protein [Actinoplanes sp. NPDC051470]|uniref:head-tail connector protein n=1 Tax=Actinoplanes sp. NPDC051470 TaxID=3157224 RepID=UPI00341561EB
MAYATLAEAKAYRGIDVSDTEDDARITAVLSAVSAGIDNVCQRTFIRDEAESARTFEVQAGCFLEVDDFYTTTGLLISGSAWSSSAYLLKPRNGVQSGQSGWPYTSIWPKATSWAWWYAGREITITARWGWAAVPAPVKEACLIATSDMLGLKDARFGVAGYGEFGPMRVRENGAVMSMLAPYVRDPVLVG